MVGNCENPLQGTIMRAQGCPAVNAHQTASDYPGQSLSLLEFLAALVRISIEISITCCLWEPTEVGTLTDMRI